MQRSDLKVHVQSFHQQVLLPHQDAQTKLRNKYPLGVLDLHKCNLPLLIENSFMSLENNNVETNLMLIFYN